MRKSASALTMRAPKSSERKDWFSFKNLSDDEGEIDIYGEIGGFSWWDDDETVTASSFRKKLKDFKDKKRIVVHINSPGGSVFEGLAIYNALKQHDAEVKVVVDALAASAASFIAMAADPGQLIMARNSVMMIHDAATYAAGNAEDMREIADLLDMHSDNIADIYSQRTGEDAVFWRTAMQAETWYTGAEAVSAGLADATLEDENEEAEKVAASFDLSIYNYAGREVAPAPSVVHKRIKSMMNQAKEAPVGKLTNSDTEKPEENAGATGDGQPIPEGGAPTPSSDGTVEQDGAATEEKEQEEPGNRPPSEGQVPAVGAPENKVTAVIINGVPTTDLTAIQRHVNALETSAKESKEAARKAFVASLAAPTSNKITAAQISDLEEFALDLSDKQYEKWTASWDAAAPLPLLGSHGRQGGTPTQQADEAKASDEIKTLEEIVAHNKAGGMTQAQLEKTPSYMKLQQLKSTTQS